MDVEIKSFIKVWSIALVSTYNWVPLAMDCPFGPIASCFRNIPSIRLNARVTHLLPHSCESHMGGDVLLYRTRNVHGCWVRAQEKGDDWKVAIAPSCFDANDQRFLGGDKLLAVFSTTIEEWCVWQGH